MSDDCIFCKISSGQMDTEFLYEDDQCVVFNDINPKAKTHLLIVSKRHLPSLADAQESDAELLSHMLLVAKKVAADKELKGYRVQIHTGREGGQEVFHLHYHLMSPF
ncbi:MAG: histidine triad nucleotide-binding protein [Nitrospirota bacterium]